MGGATLSQHQQSADSAFNDLRSTSSSLKTSLSPPERLRLKKNKTLKFENHLFSVSWSDPSFRARLVQSAVVLTWPAGLDFGK